MDKAVLRQKDCGVNLERCAECNAVYKCPTRQASAQDIHRKIHEFYEESTDDENTLYAGPFEHIVI